MCGRFGLEYDDNFYPRFKVKKPEFPWVNRYNIAPGSLIETIIKPGNERFLKQMTWGFKPTWAKADFRPLINARGETLLKKPSFRDAARKNRCLIPAIGYYEWRQEGETKQPHFIHSATEPYLSLAGIYEEKNNHFTVAIVTTQAHGGIRQIHERMPLVLSEKQEESWLNQATDLDQWLSDNLNQSTIALASKPVAKSVNNPANDSRDLLAALV